MRPADTIKLELPAGDPKGLAFDRDYLHVIDSTGCTIWVGRWSGPEPQTRRLSRLHICCCARLRASASAQTLKADPPRPDAAGRLYYTCSPR